MKVNDGVIQGGCMHFFIFIPLLYIYMKFGCLFVLFYSYIRYNSTTTDG